MKEVTLSMEEKELFWQELLEYIRHYGGLGRKDLKLSALVPHHGINRKLLKLRVSQSYSQLLGTGELKNVVVDFPLIYFLVVSTKLNM